MYEVSVIIPVYNDKKHLDRCLSSILKQTYQNIEIVLVNDGSTDGSKEVCDEFSHNFNNVRIIHQENKGSAAARETGVYASTGRYIMFVDSDDWIAIDMIAIMYNHIENSGADFISCQYLVVNHLGQTASSHILKEDTIDCKTKLDSLHHFLETRHINGSSGGKLIRRDLFIDFDFYKGLAIGEDVSMILSLLEKSSFIRVINQELYYYYKNFTSISHSGYTEGHKKGFYNYIILREDLLVRYPQLIIAIHGYFAEYEMAVITAMCRNSSYDKKVIRDLQLDLKRNFKYILKNRTTLFYLKVCAILIAIEPAIFCFIFKIIHRITSR